MKCLFRSLLENYKLQQNVVQQVIISVIKYQNASTKIDIPLSQLTRLQTKYEEEFTLRIFVKNPRKRCYTLHLYMKSIHKNVRLQL